MPKRKSRRALFIDTFTTELDDLKMKEQRDPRKVLRTLQRVGRFSVFEATKNQTIATTLTNLVKDGLLKVDNRPGFPWSNAIITKKGQKFIKEGAA